MRKIKLMALLLAALMIVAAFAGCAQVKQSEVDDLDERVTAIEELLKGQQAILDEIKNNSNNQEILDKLEEVKEELNEKIENLDNRVDAVEKEEGKGETDAAALNAAKADALATLKTAEAAFTGAKSEYDDATFATIVAAIATAEASVNAATTVEAVNTAMATYEKATEGFKSQKVVLYEHYVALFGNLNSANADAFAAAKKALAAAEAQYKDKSAAELKEFFLYEVEKGVSETRNGYLDIYNSVKNLIWAYESTSGTETKTIDYVNDKGRVKTLTIYSLEGYKTQASKIDKAISSACKTIVSSKLVDKTYYYGDETTKTSVANVNESYEQYVENATLVGGDELIALVKESALLNKVADEIKRLEDAANAFKTLYGPNAHGLYFFEALTSEQKVAYTATIGNETVYMNEYYEETADKLDAWLAEYGFDAASDNGKNVNAIVQHVVFNELKAHTKNDTKPTTNEGGLTDAGTDGAWFYEDYLLARQTVKLYTEAYNKFVTDIVPQIKALNALTTINEAAVVDYTAAKESFEKFFELQKKADGKTFASFEKSTDRTTKAYNISISENLFREFLAESGVLVLSSMDDLMAFDNVNDIGKAKDAADKGRLEKIKISDYKTLKAGFADLFTFSSDIEALENANKSYIALTESSDVSGYKYEYSDGERVNGNIYKFFNDDYKDAETEAEKINKIIKEYFVANENSADSKKKLGDDINYYVLEGKCVPVNPDLSTTLGAFRENEHKDKVLFVNKYSGKKYTFASIDTWQLLVAEDIFTAYDSTAGSDGEPIGYSIILPESDEPIVLGDLEVKLNETEALAIECYNDKYPLFTSLVEVDDFYDAWDATKERITDLRDEFVNDITGLINAIQTVTLNKNNYVYVDKDGNGKYETGTNKDDAVDKSESAITQYVSLADKAAVDAAYEAFRAWEEKGGSFTLGLMELQASGLYASNAKRTDIKNAEKNLNNLSDQIAKLADLADAIADTLEIINKVNAFEAITIDSFAKGEAKANVGKHVEDDAVKYDIVKITKIKTGTLIGESVLEIVEGSDGEATVTVNEIVKVFVDLYNKFKALNLDYDNETKIDNDFYYTKSYSEYAPVEDAVAEYVAAYDLVVAKGIIVAALNAHVETWEAKTDDDNAAIVLPVLRNHIKDIKGAADAAQLNTRVGLYNVDVTDKNIYGSQLGKDYKLIASSLKIGDNGALLNDTTLHSGLNSYNFG